jgi:hypothetical protein
MDKQTDKWINGQTDGWMDAWMDRQIDRQIEPAAQSFIVYALGLFIVFRCQQLQSLQHLTLTQMKKVSRVKENLEKTESK